MDGRSLAHGARRALLFYPVMVVIFAAFAWKLLQLQVVEGDYYLGRADENRYSRVSLPAARGIIYDRNGLELVRNVPSFNVSIVPAYLPDTVEYELNEDGSFRSIVFGARTTAILQRVAELTGVPFDTPEGQTDPLGRPVLGISEMVAEQEGFAPYKPVIVKRDVPRDIALVIREQLAEMPGVRVDVVPVRDYPTGALTAHLIGYLGPIHAENAEYYTGLGFRADRDKVGYAGIEYSQQELLAGRNGEKLIEVDVAGLELRTVGEPIQPTPGYNLRLTVDTRLQAIAEAALKNKVETMNAYFGRTVSSSGVVIAMNPMTGEVLAMVSWPAYDNNRFAFLGQGNIDPSKALESVEYYDTVLNDPTKPLANHAISGYYPPGSVYKMVAAIGALQEGVIAPERRLEDKGSIVISNKYFPNDPGKAKEFVCWNRDGHGFLDWIGGIANSCDVYFYKIGGGYENEVKDGGLGIDRLGYYAHALGYGELSGIDLPGELKGLVPTRDWKRINYGENWATGDTYIATIGQGFVAATPIQVLNSIATIANGGKLMQPTLVREVLDGEGNVVRPFEPIVRWDLADDAQDSPYDLHVDPSIIALAQRAMREVVVNGTATEYANLDAEGITSAGKTGTAEYCDDQAQDKNLCEPGAWPTHAWYAAYAPFEAPEIAVVAFVYNGGEGSVTSGPIVAEVLRGYFQLKAIDASRATQP